jgi:hypothetical protein
MPALYGEKKKTKENSNFDATSGTPSAAAAVLSLRVDANEMKPEELRSIVQGCLAYLNQSDKLQVLEDHVAARFVPYLVTATLGLAMAPRQQVLRQLRIGSSFVKKDDGKYWIVMLAHMNKNGKATMFPVGQELTAAYDLYLSEIRPRLLGDKEHDYVFCKQNGGMPGPAFDFSDWTRKVCKELIGRPINCHAFRSALVTTYYKGGATQSEMNALADVMAHDPATARDYYFKDDAQQQALNIQDRMRAAYGLNDVKRGPTTQVVQSDQIATTSHSPDPEMPSISSPGL